MQPGAPRGRAGGPAEDSSMLSKKRIFEIVDKPVPGDWASRVFDGVIMTFIALSVAAIVLESYEGLYSKYQTAFKVFDWLSVAVFAVEYGLRVWTADLLDPAAKHPRWKYVLSFMAIIDLLAILPFFLPFLHLDLRFLRMLRLLRLFRVLKLTRYLEALTVMGRVIRSSASQLIVSVVLCFFVMLFSAIIMYTVEHPVQPQKFPNVISSLWWAMCTLTTVGYGDVYPVTAVGRFFASIIALVGIGIIAIPTGILAAGFTAVINERRRDRGNGQTEGKDRENREDGQDEDDKAEKGEKRRKEEGEVWRYCPYCGHKLIK